MVDALTREMGMTPVLLIWDPEIMYSNRSLKIMHLWQANLYRKHYSMQKFSLAFSLKGISNEPFGARVMEFSIKTYCNTNKLNMKYCL
jgi:hypothetical protein